MFQGLIALFTIRSLLIIGSSIFSIMFMMIVLNIMTINEAIAILHLSPEMADTFKSIVCRSREFASNLMEILVQILNKLFAWSGNDVDFGRINIGGADASCANVSAGGSQVQDLLNSIDTPKDSVVQ
jgi:hypothetical protein